MRLSLRDRVLGALVVMAGVLFQSLWLGRAAALLSVALIVAYAFWLGAWNRPSRSLQGIYWMGLLVFVFHASEEFLTGFHRRLPAFVGEQWTDTQFLAFNAVWIVAFVAAGWALRRGRPLALLIVLFFAVGGGVGNGVAHLVLVLS